MLKIRTAINLLKSPGDLIIALANKKLLNWIPDELYLKCFFRIQTGYCLNLKNPRTFNEKLQWLKLHDRKDLYHSLVDKYEVKAYVASIIGDKYIIPTIGIWDDVDRIPFKKLPKQFVLKCTHDSGSVIICRDKSKLDFEEAKNKLKRYMKKSIYWFGREWPYKGLKPKVIAEKYMEDGGEGLIDYKVLCFNGQPKLIEVHAGRMTPKHTQDFYTTNWKRTAIEQFCEPMADMPMERPKVLNEMLELSKTLSQGFIHIRVDWYIIQGKLYFGELTFYDGAGFAPFIDKKWDYMLGDLIHLD